MPLTNKKLKAEISERLIKLRKTVGEDRSAERIAALARQQGLKVSARAIRNWEGQVGTLRIETLHALLTYYGTTLGQFFRFTLEDEDGRMIAALTDLLLQKPHFRARLKAWLEMMSE